MSDAIAFCAVEGCDRKVEARGWCKPHYERVRRGRPLGSAIIRPSRETIGRRATTHGHTVSRRDTPTYRSWASMVNRCTNPKTPNFANYGGRGITVCDRWRLSFVAFLADMGERPSLEHSLDRWPNNDGNYKPGNCRWATQSEQCRNRRTCRPILCSDGRHFPTIIDAAEAVGGNRRCIRDVCTGRQKTHLGMTWRFADE